MVIQTFTEQEIASFRIGGKILRECLAMLAAEAVEGVTTASLDAKAEEFIRDHGAVPAFKGFQGFPSTLCTSLNEECVHGMPGPRVLRVGDLLKLDAGVCYDELITDACVTVGIGGHSLQAATLVAVTQKALDAAIGILKAGLHVGDISSIIQKTVERGGFRCIRALTGHGLGKKLHQDPDIPNIGRSRSGPIFPANTVIAIEPITALSTMDIVQMDDGWTLVTKDRSLSAHIEHTLLVVEGGCEVLA